MMQHVKTGPLVNLLERADSEADVDYLRRVRDALPNLPEQVVDDWFRRHGTIVLTNTAYLDHRGLQFSIAKWPTQVFFEVTTRCEISDWSEAFVRRVPGFFHAGNVSNYILQHGTWPVAPAVLVGPGRSVGQIQLGQRHLLEGHHRLAYLRGMAQERNPALRSTHEVWEVREPE